MKSFLNPRTGTIVQYPDHFAELKPYIIEVDETAACSDCFLEPQEQEQEQEPEQEQKGKRHYAKLGTMTDTTMRSI